MNKVLYSFWSLMLVASMVFNTSCGQEEDVTPAAPFINISGVTDPTGTTANVGQAVSFTVDVAAAGGFSSIRVDKTVGTGSTTTYGEQAKPAGQTITSFTFPFSYTPTSAEAGQRVTFDFVVTDDNAKSSTHTFVVTVNEPAISTHQAVLMGAQKNTAEGSFYNAIDKQVYLLGAAQNNKGKVDLLYYYGANNLATLAAPTDADSKVVFGETNLQGMNNGTNLVRTTAVFADVKTSSDIRNAWLEKKAGTVDTKVTSLKVGDVVAFQLADTRGYRLGVAQVVSVDAVNTGKITINVKMQTVDN